MCINKEEELERREERRHRGPIGEPLVMEVGAVFRQRREGETNSCPHPWVHAVLVAGVRLLQWLLLKNIKELC